MSDLEKDGHRRDAPRSPGGLPLFNVAGEWGGVAFEPGDEFWRNIEELTTTDGPASQLDEAMAGKASPRIWLILHQADEPELGAVTALGFARELGKRGQAAIVLDCDDRQQSLTRWAERLEADGWIDMARYGVSVMAAGHPLPFGGRKSYLLGVGSFAPTEVTRAEIDQMAARLRRQADDLILVVPADDDGMRWGPVANLRLLCWNRASRSADEVAALAGSWSGAGHPLTGLIGLGADAVAESAAEGDAEPAVADEKVESPGNAPLAEPEARVEPEPAAEEWEEADPALARRDGRRGTSGVFWFVLSAAVVTVCILAIYWFQYVRVPGQDEGAATRTVLTQAETERQPADRTTGELANQDDGAGPADEQPSGTLADSAVAEVSVAGDETSVGQDSVATSLASEARADEEPATGGGAAEFGAAESDATVPGFRMAPYKEEVGSRGWALHLYSLPNERSVEVELTELHRRGFETAVRAIETEDKGRWWRVYVGSFDSRTDAKAAAPLLKENLGTDWANPVRF